MKVESVSTNIDFVGDRIRRRITKTLVDEVTQKKVYKTETFFETAATYNKKAKLESIERNQVDIKI